LLEYRQRGSGKLMGVMFSDMQQDGISAVYSFFDQSEAQRSLGKFMILDLIKRTRAGCKPYVYLGYWIAESRKMAYKTSYKPCEVFTNGRWQNYGPTDNEVFGA
jgi:arginine-tRNA-protein transferase